MITGRLSSSSPLWRIFKDGNVPLSRVGNVSATLGDQKVPQLVRLVAMHLVTKEQKAEMVRYLLELGQGPEEDALEVVNQCEEFPLRECHFDGPATVPLRSFV